MPWEYAPQLRGHGLPRPRLDANPPGPALARYPVVQDVALGCLASESLVANGTRTIWLIMCALFLATIVYLCFLSQVYALSRDMSSAYDVLGRLANHGKRALCGVCWLGHQLLDQGGHVVSRRFPSACARGVG